MRYGVIPMSLMERVAAALHKIPFPILDVLIGPMQARALMAAVDLGIVDILAAGPSTADDIASRARLDAECVHLLLRVLRGMGYVSQRRSHFSLTASARRYFGPDAIEPYSAFVKYGPPQWTMMEQLEHVVRTGRGVDFHEHQTPEEWRLYQPAMLENARAFAWFVVENLPVPEGATTCLDIAGAHGYVSAALCRRHPGLRAIVLDRPEALASARELAARAGHQDIVQFREGDLLTDSFGRGVNVALLCNILHHFAAETNQDILRRVHEALAPGGTVGIFDIETPPAEAQSETAADVLALYFRITSTSTCFRAADYERWLARAGFRDVRVVRSIKMPSRMLVVGTR